MGIQPVHLRAGKVQQRPVNLREPNLALFSDSEIAQVDAVITSLADSDSDTVSELSHEMVGWQVVDEGATIPYNSVFVFNPH